jgi:hypothetical protein
MVVKSECQRNAASSALLHSDCSCRVQVTIESCILSLITLQATLVCQDIACACQWHVECWVPVLVRVTTAIKKTFA